MSGEISIYIDGEQVTASAGASVFEAARRANRPIPGLCQMQGIAPVGACRLCVVELAGTSRLLTSCTTPAQDGMAVITDSPRLRAYRRMVVELLLAEGNHVCSVCVSNNHCELQALAADLGVTRVRFSNAHPKHGVDVSHPRFVLDRNRCILCTRCVRVCAEIEGASVWDLMGRGASARLIADMNQPWGDAKSCTGCGKCVEACPTGALAEKGFAGSEMIKHPERIADLVLRRRSAP